MTGYVRRCANFNPLCDIIDDVCTESYYGIRPLSHSFHLTQFQVYTARASRKQCQNQVWWLPQLPGVHQTADNEEAPNRSMFPSQSESPIDS